MIRSKTAYVLAVAACVITLSISASIASPAPAPTSEAEKTVWDLEHSYWHLVEANDLASYRKLWHADFLGWPSVACLSRPQRPHHRLDHHAGKRGPIVHKLIAFKPAAIQSSDSTVTACYWLTYKWIDQSGKGDQRTVRVFHTWVKNGNDWQIISGMSMPEAKLSPQK